MVRLRIRELAGAKLKEFWKPLGLSWDPLGALLELSQGTLRGLENLLGATLEAFDKTREFLMSAPRLKFKNSLLGALLGCF